VGGIDSGWGTFGGRRIGGFGTGAREALLGCGGVDKDLQTWGGRVGVWWGERAGVVGVVVT